MEAVVNQAVAMDNIQMAEINYSTHTGGVTVDQLDHIDWEEDVHFKCNNSNSRSFEVADILGGAEDLALDWLFNMSTGGGENNLMVDFWDGEECFLLLHLLLVVFFLSYR